MAIALVTSVSAGNTTSNADFTTGAVTTTGATLFVAAIAEYDPGRTGGALISDSKSNTWTPLPIYTEGGTTTQIRLFYAVPPDDTKRGTGHTFTYNNGGALATYGSLCVAAFSGTHATTPLDLETGADSSGANPAPGSVSPTTDGQVLVTAAACEAYTITSVDSGFTILENIAVSGAHISAALAYKIQTTATLTTVVWTLPGADQGSAAIATFKAAAAADTTPPVLSAGSPSGEQVAGTTSVVLNVTTNEAATAKWGTVASTAYASLPNTFATTGGTSHSTSMTGLTDGTSYTVYVRAQDTAGNPTLSDYPITFSVAASSGVTTVTFHDLVERRNALMRADARITVILARPGVTSSDTPATYLIKDPDPGDSASTGATDQANAKGGQTGGRNLAWKEYSYDDAGTAYGLEGAPVPPSPGGDDPDIIAASTWRFDGNSGTVLVSSGFPLRPGQVTASTVSEVRVYVAGVEKAVAIHPLDGKHPDGSYRSIGIQFSHSLTDDTPVDAEVHVNTGTGRGTTDLTWTEPTHITVKNRAVIVPTDPAHLCATFVTLCPLTPAVNDAGLGAAWAAYATTRWSDANVANGSNAGGAVYDHQHGLLSIYCRTGTRSWYEWWYNWANSMNGDPLSGITPADGMPNVDSGPNQRGAAHLLLPQALPYHDPLRIHDPDSSQPLYNQANCQGNSTFNPEATAGDAPGLLGMNTSCGGPPEWFSLRHVSLASAYWMSAWRQHKRIIARNANQGMGYSSGGYAALRDHWVTFTYGHRYNFGSAGLLAMLMGYLTGMTTQILTPPGLEGPATWDYATYLPWMIDALVETKWNDGSYANGIVGQRHTTGLGETMNPDAGITNFMVGIATEFLMLYYDNVYPDARIPGLIKDQADYVISQIRPTFPFEQKYPDKWIMNYVNGRPAYVADPTMTVTTVASNTTVTRTGGTAVISDLRGNGTPIYGSCFAGGETYIVTANEAGGTFTVNVAPTSSGSFTVTIGAGAGWYTNMLAVTFAWVYAYTGNPTYATWRDRAIHTANIHVDNLTYATKIWGEFFGGTKQQALYYMHGGTIRGTTGVHPTVITNPPLQPTLG